MYNVVYNIQHTKVSTLLTNNVCEGQRQKFRNICHFAFVSCMIYYESILNTDVHRIKKSEELDLLLL